MPYVRLKGPLSAQYYVKGRYLQGGLEYDLSEEEIKSHREIIQSPLSFEQSSKTEDKVFSVGTKHLYTSKELTHLNKSEQVAILNSLGVKKVPPLEKDRMELILSLQRGEVNE